MYIVFVLGSEWDDQTDEFCKRLFWEKLKWIHSTEKTIMADVERLQTLKMELLVITDNCAVSKKLSEQNIICIGCDASTASFFDGAILVTDSLANLEVRTLKEYLIRAKGEPVIVGETERLVIREITEQDFDVLYRISRQEGMQYARAESGEDIFEREYLSAYIQHAYQFFGYGLWSVVRTDGVVIGCCGFRECGDDIADFMQRRPEKNNISGDEKDCETGRCLELQYMISQEFQQQGYGTEACRAAIEIAFVRMECEELWLRIHPQNHPSLKLAEKLGFISCGRTKDGSLLMKTTNAAF